MVSSEATLLRDAGHQVFEHRVRNPSDSLSSVSKLAVAPWNPSSHAGIGVAIDETRPDVAHLHNTWFSLSPSVVGALADRGIPTVMSLHNYRLLCINGLLLRDGEPCRLCVGTGPGSGVRYRCYRDSVFASMLAALTLSLNRVGGTWESVALFLANSQFTRDTYIDSGMEPGKVAIKPNFVADPGPRLTSAADSKVVLYVGRVSPEKGVDFLCDVWEQSDMGDLILRVIGSGPDLDRLRRAHPTVEFVGRLAPEEVANQMLAGRALVFPSLAFETCPLSIIEAFSAGMPVIANRRGAMTELVGLLDESWLCEAGNPADWTRALRDLKDDGRIGAASLRARQAYESSFTRETALELLELAYASAIN